MPLRKEIRGILFVLVAIMLGVSLFSYHPSDPVFGLKTSQAAEVHNLFGKLGAHLSGWVFQVLGFSSFWLVAVFLAMAVLSFRSSFLLSPIKSFGPSSVYSFPFPAFSIFICRKRCSIAAGRSPVAAWSGTM
jgi:hypothetical protein